MHLREETTMNTSPTVGSSTFDRIVCAVDGSASSLEAVRQARVLRSELGTIELVSVFQPPVVEYSPYGGPLIATAEEKAAATKLSKAQALCPEASSELLRGAT